VGAQHADRLPALHEHGLVVAQGGQGPHQGVVGLPIARCLAGSAVHDELGRVLGVLRVEVVHQHPQRRLGLPRPGGQLGAPGGADRQPWVLGRGHRRSPFGEGWWLGGTSSEVVGLATRSHDVPGDVIRDGGDSDQGV
jgi:hypothetical protein